MKNRIQILSDNRLKYVKREEIPVRDKAYMEMVKKYQDSSVKLQYAYGFAEVLKRKSILIQKEDLLAGYLYQYTYNINFPMQVSEEFDPAGRASFRMDVRREVEEYKEFFGVPSESATGRELEKFAEGVETWLYKHWHSGHILPGYPKLLKRGFKGLIEEVSESEKNAKVQEEKETLFSFRIVLNACVDYIKRYEKEAQRMVFEAESEEERSRLEEMRKNIENIAENPPENFTQALQLVWFAHEMMYCENVPSAISIGRLDYYLYPYYKADKEKGILDEKKAEELIQAFFIKCSLQKKAYQNLTIGGCDEEGKCSVNELTYFCIRAAKTLKFDQPSLVYRWTDDQPDQAWREVLSLIREGMGFPALMYDPCCMKARKQTGIPEDESYNYSLLGCVEFGMQGEEYSLTELLRLNLPKVLNLMLHGGRDVKTGKYFQIKKQCNLDEIKNYEELYKWYLEEVGHFIDLGIRSIQKCEELYSLKYPLPYLSVLMENCIESRKDVSEGGAKYNNAGVNLGGIATAADSLAAIKKLVFEEKILTLAEYAEILERDFEGAEFIQNLARYHCPKFGNDEEGVDSIATEIIEFAENRVDKYSTIHGGPYRLGLYTVEDHALMGMSTGATADGRRSGLSLSNSMGAVQGMDKNGPTASLNSAVRKDLSCATNGMVLDIKFVPSFLEKEAGQKALRSLIQTYFMKGGMEIQVSVVSRETLLAAQKEPDKYTNLVVRVSGFSANFVSLRKVTQDEIISRTECG